MRAVRALGAAIVLVSILNGAETFLRRVGARDKVLYERAWSEACGERGMTDTPLGLGRRCAPLPDGTPSSVSDDRNESTGYVFGARGWGLVPKLAKDLVLAALVAAGLFASGLTSRRTAISGWLLWALVGLAGLGGMAAAVGGDWVGLISGSRSLLFVAVALLGTWATTESSLEILGKSVTALLGAEVILMPVELARGLPLHRQLPFWGLPGRMAGTLVMPNSLGVLAAVGLAFVLCFVPARGWRIAAAVSATVLIGLSASATGWVLLVLLAAVWLDRRARAGAFRRSHYRAGLLVAWIAAAGVAAAFAFLLLPRLVNRADDLSDSIGSRLAALRQLTAAPARQVLLGERLGAGSNTEVSIKRARADTGNTQTSADPGPGDSLVASVTRQVGIVGLALLVAAAVATAMGDAVARPFLLAVAAAALVSNLAELFPVNLLFGLVLARRTRLERDSLPR